MQSTSKHKLPAAFAIIIALTFIFGRSHNGLLEFIWWLPLVASLFVLQLRIASETKLSNFTKQTLILSSGFISWLSVVVFNHTGTVFFIGGWLLILYYYVVFMSGNEPNKTTSQLLFGLVALALLLLPVDINRISIKLPSLSPLAYFSIHQVQGDQPILSSHYYQRLPSYEEMEVLLSAKYHPRNSSSAPLLKITSDQDGIVYVLQDIQYRHTLGLFKKTFFSVGEKNMSNLTVLPDSDPADIDYPEIGGMRIVNLWENETMWIQLPAMQDGALSFKDQSMVRLVRLLIWLFAFWVISSWRPGRILGKAA